MNELKKMQHGFQHQWQTIAMAMGSFARNKQTNNSLLLFQQKVREFAVLTSLKLVLLCHRPFQRGKDGVPCSDKYHKSRVLLSSTLITFPEQEVTFVPMGRYQLLLYNDFSVLVTVILYHLLMEGGRAQY